MLLPVIAIGSCIAVVVGLSTTIWDDGGEPSIIRKVEPVGVARVEQETEKWYGTDDGYGEQFLLFYVSEKPFGEVQQEYTEAMAKLGYVANVTEWADGSGKNIRFRKKGNEGKKCFDLGTYPHGIITQRDHRSRELEGLLSSNEYGFIVSYSVHHGWFRTTASC